MRTKIIVKVIEGMKEPTTFTFSGNSAYMDALKAIEDKYRVKRKYRRVNYYDE